MPSTTTMEATKNNAQKVWAAVVRHAKEHHASVNAAVITYYPQPLSTPASSSYSSYAVAPPPSTASSSPRCSFEKPEPIVITSAKSSSSTLGKAWNGVKKHIKE